MKNFTKEMLLLILVLRTAMSTAQVMVQFIPALNGQTINGLFMAQVQNNAPVTYNGKLQITVRDAGNNIMVKAITPFFVLKPGANPIQALGNQARWQFGNTSAARIAAETGRFTENDYEYCFEFTGAENKTGANERVFENCYNYSVQPVFPLMLVYPADGDVICEQRPAFTWQAGIPVGAGYQYKLVAVEKKENQALQDALLNNIPVFQQDNIPCCTAHYPPQLAELQKGKKYGWQVTAFQGANRVTQSDAWIFSINCNDKKADSSKESYRQPGTSLDGNYYMAAGTIKFSVINPYGPAIMQYSLTDIANPGAKIGNLPLVKLQTGLNKIDLPLEDISGIAVNKMYLLKITNIGDHILYLQFINKGNEHY